MKKISKLYYVAYLLLLNIAVFAQPGDDAEGGGLEDEDPMPGAPINNKLILLTLVGIIFIIYTYRKNRKTA